MATFPAIAATYGSINSSSPSLVEIQYGDGYSQVLKYGLNQNRKTWNLNFVVSEADATTIEDFLNARADDGDTFDWQPPDETTSYKWRCFRWSKRIPYKDRATITATFTQYFEP